MKKFCVFCHLIFLLCNFLVPEGLVFGSSAESYEFKIENELLPMGDGVSLSVTYYLPTPKVVGEKFPVLLEMQPYRKDDLFQMRDYALNSFFVKRGFVLVKADVRGTGSSHGTMPDREYSEREIQDGVDLVDALSRKSWSNGNVGMWGISWSGFNAIMVAMKNPKPLKAILAVDASDDLFHDDVHFLDGAFHIDQYELSIENDLSLPPTPDYSIDSKFFKERFDRKPWFFRYKEMGNDGPFWRKNSLRRQYEKLKVPAFLIGGLLDGYKDSIPRMLDHATVSMRAIVGPWNHAWPDNGEPTPNVEWRNEAIRWWSHWLRDEKNDVLAEPNFTFFQRAGDLPNKKLAVTQGKWLTSPWPLKTKERSFFLSPQMELLNQPTLDLTSVSLKSQPDVGRASGLWWGEPTPNMVEDDRVSSSFDSIPFEEPIQIAGTMVTEWEVATNAQNAIWVAQVEDVFPSGESSLVTGALLNGTQLKDATNPRSQPKGSFFKMQLPLHFTTYTFQKNHRLRLVLRNSNFPMVWPTKELVKSKIIPAHSKLTIPVLEEQSLSTPAKFLSEKVEPRDELPNSKEISTDWPKEERDYIDSAGMRHVIWQGFERFSVGSRVHEFNENTDYSVNLKKPWLSAFEGRAGHLVEIDEKRKIETTTKIDVRSNQKVFEVKFVRTLLENGKIIRQKVWQEKIPRKFH